MKKIKETHVVFNIDGYVELLAVLWEDGDFVRATLANYYAFQGYEYIKPKTSISNDLIQRVANAGRYLTDEEKKKYFPGKRKWSR